MHKICATTLQNQEASLFALQRQIEHIDSYRAKFKYISGYFNCTQKPF